MWEGLTRLAKNEPTIIISIARYAILLGVTYGLATSDEQMALILGLVELVLLAFNRAAVSPVSQVSAQADRMAERIIEERAEPLTEEERRSLNELRDERDSLRREVRERGYR